MLRPWSLPTARTISIVVFGVGVLLIFVASARLSDVDERISCPSEAVEVSCENLCRLILTQKSPFPSTPGSV